MRQLTGQVMIITGASSGIGAATAIACAKAGMNVVINARREVRLQAVAAQVEAHGGRAVIVAGDVATPGISEQMLDAAVDAFGRCDAVFANAGYGLERSMTEVTPAELREMFEVNFFAGVDLLQKAAKRWIARGQGGHLLMCSSCLAKFSLPLNGPYCATKAAQNQICRAMRIELKPHGIHVASVHPIGTYTEFFESSTKRSGKDSSDDHQPIVSNTPRMFMQPPERVANAVIRCLRRPTPEVWTSTFVRLAAALMVASPRLGDWMLSRAGKIAQAK